MKSQDITALLDQLCSIYDQSVANLREALGAYCEDGAHPDPELRANGCFAYPELRVAYSGERTAGRLTRAFARLTAPGNYACSVARPALFRDYLKTQLEHLVGDYGVEVSVGTKPQRNPLRLCARRKRHQPRRRDGRRAVALVSVERARRTSATRSPTASGTIRSATRGRWPCSTARAPTSASRG